MPLILPKERLIRVSKSQTLIVKNWEEGVSLQKDSGKTITDLMQVVATDRWYLGFDHRRQANRLLYLSSPLYRSAVSRYYYAMYHSMRACVYIFHRGDDYENHSELPKHIPTDFDKSVNWGNILKDARTIRNNADYDPYPKADLAWKKSAFALKINADKLLIVSRDYLKGKGCKL